MYIGEYKHEFTHTEIDKNYSTLIMNNILYLTIFLSKSGSILKHINISLVQFLSMMTHTLLYSKQYDSRSTRAPKCVNSFYSEAFSRQNSSLACDRAVENVAEAYTSRTLSCVVGDTTLVVVVVVVALGSMPLLDGTMVN